MDQRRRKRPLSPERASSGDSVFSVGQDSQRQLPSEKEENRGGGGTAFVPPPPNNASAAPSNPTLPQVHQAQPLQFNPNLLQYPMVAVPAPQQNAVPSSLLQQQQPQPPTSQYQNLLNQLAPNLNHRNVDQSSRDNILATIITRLIGNVGTAQRGGLQAGISGAAGASILPPANMHAQQHMLSMLHQQHEQRTPPPRALSVYPENSGIGLTTGTGAKRQVDAPMPKGGSQGSNPKVRNPLPERLPCRARGMPEAHDFNTAYFIIKPETRHGEKLICSFPKCREDGVKFLFCSFCRDAIGKRVFRNQHHHLDDTGQAPVPSTGTGTPAAHGQIGQLDTAGMIPTGLPVLSAVTGAVTGGAVTGTRVSVQKSSQADQSQMIPCRARGIPDHDFKRAYFIITPDTSHGQGLPCSHAACRNSGIKFRWCIVCQDAIARRNFKQHSLQHHKDGYLQASEYSGLDGVDPSDPPMPHKAPARTLKMGDANGDGDGEDASGVGDIKRSMSRNDPTSKQNQGGRHRDEDGGSLQSHTGDDEKDLSPSERQRRIEWLRLLKQRPKGDNSPEMYQWLEKVKKISDPETLVKTKP